MRIRVTAVLCLSLMSFGLSAKEISIDQGPNATIDDSRDMIETGFAAPGSSLHRWMKTQVRSVADDVGFKYSVHVKSTGLVPFSFVEEVAKVDVSRKESIMLEDSPGEPSGTPHGIPSSATSTDTCGRLRIGGSSATGTITFTWSYQNRTASVQGGPKDSNPGWVLTGFTASNIEYHPEGSALNC